MNPRNEASYRITLKRCLHAVYGVNNRPDISSIKELEIAVKEAAINAPATVAHAIEKRFRFAASKWEEGNNSGHAATLAVCSGIAEGVWEGVWEGVRKACALLGVEVTFPGLYPMYEKNGRQELFGGLERLVSIP